MWMVDMDAWSSPSGDNPSGSLGSGKSQAQCAGAGLLPGGCGAAVVPELAHIKAS